MENMNLRDWDCFVAIGIEKIAKTHGWTEEQRTDALAELSRLEDVGHIWD